MADLPAGRTPLRDPNAATERELVEETREPTEDLLPSGREGTGISPDVRQQLDQQIDAAGGDINRLMQDVRARIEELDSRTMPEEGVERQQMQADRAFYVAQLSYLEQRMDPRSRA
jgi:hypothetical protein